MPPALCRVRASSSLEQIRRFSQFALFACALFLAQSLPLLRQRPSISERRFPLAPLLYPQSMM